MSLWEMSFEIRAEESIALNSRLTSPAGFFIYLLLLPLPASLVPFLEWDCLDWCIPPLHFEIIQFLWFCKLVARQKLASNGILF